MPNKPLTVTHNGQDYLVSEADWARLEVGIFEPVACEHCGCVCHGLEPLYPLAIAAAMVPFESEGAARKWLSTNKKHVSKPPLYKKIGARWRRYLSVTDICRIRGIIFNPHRRGRVPAAPEAQLMRFANAHDDSKRADLIVEEIERRANAD